MDYRHIDFHLFPRPSQRVLGSLVFAASLCAFEFCGSSSFAQSPDGDPPRNPILPNRVERDFSDAELDALISDLHSNEFHTRETATEQLQQASIAMLDNLTKRYNNITEPEPRARLFGVITRLRYEHQQKTIKAFLRDPDLKQTHGLEGWESFSQSAGVSRSSKQLFLKLIDQYPDLVESKLEDKNAAFEKARAIASVIQDSNIRGTSLTPEDGLAFLFCVNQAQDLFDKNLELTSRNTFLRAPFTRLLTDTQFRAPLGEMLFQWANRVEEYQADTLTLMMSYSLPQAREIAIRLLNSTEVNAVDPETGELFILCMQALFRFGTAADLPVAEKWLDDKRVCRSERAIATPGLNADPKRLQPPNPNRLQPPNFIELTIELRDVAVIVGTQLRRGNPAIFFPQMEAHELRGFKDLTVMSPADDEEQRAKRVAEYRNWVELRLKPAGK